MWVTGTGHGACTYEKLRTLSRYIILTQALITHQKSIYRKRITAPIYYSIMLLKWLDAINSYTRSNTTLVETADLDLHICRIPFNRTLDGKRFCIPAHRSCTVGWNTTVCTSVLSWNAEWHSGENVIRKDAQWSGDKLIGNCYWHWHGPINMNVKSSTWTRVTHT